MFRINYLNKALELFNTSMVVPVYFCYFTSTTMITSFILYRGLKASAATLITMVLGFLVTCLGITLLQMSKVDPTKLNGLDRRSTILLQASRHTTEADEKGDVAAMEEPGMDALRGGFGAVGSIIRARSMSRRLSRNSSAASRGPYPFASSHQTAQPNLNTHGLAHLPRYQLSDNPVPEDDIEHISLSEQATAGGSSIGGMTPRSKSTLKFDDADMVHHYGYTKGGHTDALHTVRQHDELRQLPPLPRTESPEKEYADPFDHLPPQQRAERKTSFTQLFGSFTHGDLTSPVSPIRGSPSTEHGQSLAHGFRSSSGDDKQVRGGAHRGVKDYPHLSKHEQATEREERTALVRPESPSEDGHGQLPHQLYEGFPEVDLSSPMRSNSPDQISGLPSSRKPVGPR